VSLSSTFVNAINAPRTDEAFLVLLTIDHPDLASPLRLTTDGVDTTSNGNTFVPFPFDIALPRQDDETSGALARLTIDNADRRVTEALRSVNSAPQVDLEVVLASDPDTVEATWPTFQLTNARVTLETVEGDLVLEIYDQTAFPSARMDPENFPGIF
jgi:hypothetical protein